ASPSGTSGTSVAPTPCRRVAIRYLGQPAHCPADHLTDCVRSHIGGAESTWSFRTLRSEIERVCMDGTRLDNLSRGLARALSRRTLSGLGVGVALASLLPNGGVAKTSPQRLKKGKKGKGKKHRPLVLNQFGCVNVGGSCHGDGANCCS